MKVNYPELGSVDQAARWYSDGDVLEHPSGAVYLHKDGRWQLLREPPPKLTEAAGDAVTKV